MPSGATVAACTALAGEQRSTAGLFYPKPRKACGTTMSGKLEKIWIKRGKRAPMDAVPRAELVLDRGLAGNANQGGKRQVTLIEAEKWAEMMCELGSDLDPSSRRANLMVSGMALQDARNKVIRIGDCRIHIWGETRPCERMDEALPGLRDAMRSEWRGGAFGTVLTAGVIHIGDSLVWEPPPD